MDSKRRHDWREWSGHVVEPYTVRCKRCHMLARLQRRVKKLEGLIVAVACRTDCVSDREVMDRVDDECDRVLVRRAREKRRRSRK